MGSHRGAFHNARCSSFCLGAILPVHERCGATGRWIAPDLLTDAAFAALLSAGALPGLRRASEPDWNGRVFRATLPVLAVVMAVILAAAWAFTYWFPGLRTLGEATRMLF